MLRGRGEFSNVLKHATSNMKEINMVAPTGFEPVIESRHVFARFYDVFGNASHEESRPV